MSKTKRLNVTLDYSTYDKLVAMALKEDRSINNMLRRLIRNAGQPAAPPAAVKPVSASSPAKVVRRELAPDEVPNVTVTWAPAKESVFAGRAEDAPYQARRDVDGNLTVYAHMRVSGFSHPWFVPHDLVGTLGNYILRPWEDAAAAIAAHTSYEPMSETCIDLEKASMATAEEAMNRQTASFDRLEDLNAFIAKYPERFDLPA